MLHKLMFVLILLFTFNALFSQTESDSLLKAANTLYKQKQFTNAAPIFERAAELAITKILKNAYYYYAASVFASANDSINSYRCLSMAINKYGFNDMPAIKNDEAFLLMNKSGRWKKLMASIKPAYTTNPLQVKMVDSDVQSFWYAYDMVQKDSAKAEKIYKENYFDKGTIALQDYYLNKIGGNIYSFVYVHNKKKNFYKSIRTDSYKALTYKQAYFNSFKALKKIYPAAIFPTVYFVIGKLNSAGTSSSNGLILAIDQLCKTNKTDTTELEKWEMHYLSPLDNLVPTVAHELIHFQQNTMASDTTLLRAAIVEGMADFIGELISGKSANERLKFYAYGKENSIWQDFKKEMYLDHAYNWIANGDQEMAEKPADLGYWVGYQLCKAYYNNAKNKQRAIYDMLHIQDYKKFLDQSKLAEQIK